jgi:hypothetical protein
MTAIRLDEADLPGVAARWGETARAVRRGGPGAAAGAGPRARWAPRSASEGGAGGGGGGARPLRLLLHAVVALPLVLMAAGGWLTWRDSTRDAESEMARTAEAGAEYARRLLDGHRMAADRVNDLLRGLSDAEIRAREAALHAALQAMLAEAPELRSVHVGDRHGGVLLSGTVFPVPRDVSLADRDWYAVMAAEGAPTVFVSGVHMPRLQPGAGAFFALSRRRAGGGNGLPPQAFDGLVNVSFDPREVGAGLRRLLLDEPADTLSLIRADGHILARTAGLDAPLPPLPADSRFTRAVAAGAERALISGRSPLDGEVRVAALRRVEGYPLYAVAFRPRAAVAARWRDAVAVQLALACRPRSHSPASRCSSSAGSAPSPRRTRGWSGASPSAPPRWRRARRATATSATAPTPISRPRA